MKRSSPLLTWMSPCLLIAALAVLHPCGLRAAERGYGPPQEQESGFGEKIGGFFRHLFYGEGRRDRSGDPPPPPRRGRPGAYSRPSDRYNLDAPPEGMRRQPSGYDRPMGNEPPPPDRSSSRQETRSSEQKTKSRTQESRKRTEPADTVKSDTSRTNRTPAPAPAPTPEVKKTPMRETTPPPSTQITPPTPPKEPETNPAPAPRNTPSTSPSPEEKETKTVQNSPPSPAPKPPVRENKEVLTATKTENPNRVKSPYPPYTELDVTGLHSGSSALDPTSQRIFRVP